jgi:MscS family membrane protein
VLLKVSEIIASHGAEVAFPTTTVHVPNQVRLLQAATAGTPSER